MIDILDFRQFGFNYTPNVLLQHKPDLLQYLAADLEYGGKNLLEYIEASGELNQEQQNDIWIGYLTGYEANSHENLMNKLKQILSESKKRLEKSGHGHGNVSSTTTVVTVAEKAKAKVQNPNMARKYKKQKKKYEKLMESDENAAGGAGAEFDITIDTASATGGAGPGHSNEDTGKQELEYEQKMAPGEAGGHGVNDNGDDSNDYGEVFEVMNFINLQTNVSKRSLLHLLCLKQSEPELFNDLLFGKFTKNVINVNISDQKNETALHYLMVNNNTSMFDKLMSFHSNIFDFDLNLNYVNPTTGQTYLHYTILNSNEIISLSFINLANNYGHELPNVNTIDNDGNCCLHYCAEKSNMVEILLSTFEQFIDVNIQNNKNHNYAPLHKFVLYPKNNESLKHLLKFGGLQINIGDEFGNTALHYAMIIEKNNVNNDAIEHVRLLLGHNDIDISVFNANSSECGGVTPLHMCFQNRFSFDIGINVSLKSMLSKSILDKITLLLNTPNVNVNAKSLYKQNTVLHFGVCLFADRDYGIDDTFFNIQKEKLRLILNFEGCNCLTVVNGENQTPLGITQTNRAGWREEINECESRINILRTEIIHAEADVQCKRELERNQNHKTFQARSQYNSQKSRYDSARMRYESSQRSYQRSVDEYQRKMRDYMDPNHTSRSRPSESSMNMDRRRMEQNRNDMAREEGKLRTEESKKLIEERMLQEYQEQLRAAETHLHNKQNDMRNTQDRLSESQRQLQRSTDIIQLLRGYSG